MADIDANADFIDDTNVPLRVLMVGPFVANASFGGRQTTYTGSKPLQAAAADMWERGIPDNRRLWVERDGISSTTTIGAARQGGENFQTEGDDVNE